MVGEKEKQTGMGKSGHVVMLHTYKWILKTPKKNVFKKYKLRLIAGNLIFRCGGRRRDRQGGGGGEREWAHSKKHKTDYMFKDI